MGCASSQPALGAEEHTDRSQDQKERNTRDIKRIDSARAERQQQHVDLEQIRPVIDGQDSSNAAPCGDGQEDNKAALRGPVQLAAAGPEEPPPLSSGSTLPGAGTPPLLKASEGSVSPTSSGDGSRCGLDINPHEETLRTDTVCVMGLMNKPRDPALAMISEVICRVFDMPVGGVTLADSTETVLDNMHGMEGTCARGQTFCRHLMASDYPQVVMIEDARQHWRYSYLDVVRSGLFACYTGAPLVAFNGARVGALCLLDHKPRRFDAHDCLILCMFAELAMREIERTWRSHEITSAAVLARPQQAVLARDPRLLDEGVMLVDVSSPMWPVIYANSAFSELTGVSWNPAMKTTVWELFSLPSESRKVWEEHAAMKVDSDLEVDVFCPPGGTVKQVTLMIRTKRPNTFAGRFPTVGIPSVVPSPGSRSNVPSTYCFVTVHPTSRTPGSATLSPTSSTSMTAAAAIHEQYKEQLAKAGAEPRACQQPMPDEAFDSQASLSGVKLGPLLGQGSYGRVYRAQWQGAVCAVKVIESSRQEGVSIDQAQQVMEANLSAGLNHPNIVNTYRHATMESKAQAPLFAGQVCSDPLSWSDDEDELEMGAQSCIHETWMVMEYCNMGSLGDAVSQGLFHNRKAPRPENLDLLAVLRSGAEIASALCYLHDGEITHGDLSGGNVLLCSSNKDSRGFTCKVADFGFSKIMAGHQTHHTKSYGTVTHAAPELLMHGKRTKAADVWAFGVLLWEMYSGVRPWAGMAGITIIHNLTIKKRTLELPANSTPAFKVLTERCMEFDYRKRPTIGEVAKAIQLILSILTVQ